MAGIDQIIGGHPGMKVIRRDGTILKKISREDIPERYDINYLALHNEAKFLRVMSKSGFTPELLAENNEDTVQTDCGNSEPLVNGQNFRRNLFRFLWEMRRRNVRHTNLIGNVIIRGDWPWIIDWQESHFIGEKPPPLKITQMSDTWALCRIVMGTISARSGGSDEYRVGQKWLVVAGALGAVFGIDLPLRGKTLLDVGCFQGDYVAAAACEGMKVHGIDSAGFRSGEDSIEIAKGLWAGIDCRFTKCDIVDWQDFGYDVVLFLSTYPYIIKWHSRAMADAVLSRIMDQAGEMFFETQLYGDGPGPDFLKTDNDVKALLSQFGTPELLVTIPVWNRPAKRTMWRLKGTDRKERYQAEIVERSKSGGDMSLHMLPLFDKALEVRPNLIVELGIRGGVSTFALERAARLCKAKMVCVDVVNCSGSCQYAEFVQSDDVDFAHKFKAFCQERGIPPAVDILMVDTEHTYNQTKREVESWLPWMSPQCTIIFHDTNAAPFYVEVAKYLREWFDIPFPETEKFSIRKGEWHIDHDPGCFGLTMVERRSL